ncbi:MAG: DUF3810 family protein [Nanoarchaeota archaeon]|nr:DUF3810 family protein [Nanoarchaeota archaeon]
MSQPYTKKRKDPYSIKYAKTPLQTIYSEKYSILVTIENNSQESSSLESIVKKVENEIEKIDGKKIISLVDHLKNIKPKENKIEDYHPEKDKENKIYYPIFKKNQLDEGLSREIQSTAIDPKSGAKVIYVPQSSLPSNVLGMYVPSSHTIYISRDLPEYKRQFVYHHEVAHALGIRNEVQADNYAASVVGYHLRSPSQAMVSQARAA